MKNFWIAVALVASLATAHAQGVPNFSGMGVPNNGGGSGGASGANPTATAGPAAVNGVATTFLRSDGAPAVQKGSNSQFGITEGDGTTLTCTAGVCSATLTQSSGTWTPTDGSGAGLTFSAAVGTYVKVGNMIFANAYVTYPTTASGANAKITGFPATTFVTDILGFGCSPSYMGAALQGGTFMPSLQVAAGGTFMYMFGSAGLIYTNLNLSGFSLAFNCVYPAS